VHFVPGSIARFALREYSSLCFAGVSLRGRRSFYVLRAMCYVLCVTKGVSCTSCPGVSLASHCGSIARFASLEYRFAVEDRELEKEQFLCSAVRYTPIRKANDTPSMRQREILPRSDTPFFCPRIFTDFHELASGLPGFSVQISRRRIYTAFFQAFFFFIMCLNFNTAKLSSIDVSVSLV